MCFQYRRTFVFGIIILIVALAFIILESNMLYIDYVTSDTSISMETFDPHEEIHSNKIERKAFQDPITNNTYRLNRPATMAKHVINPLYGSNTFEINFSNISLIDWVINPDSLCFGNKHSQLAIVSLMDFSGYLETPSKYSIINLKQVFMSYQYFARINRLQYITKHNFTYCEFNHILDSTRHPNWSKILAVFNILSSQFFKYVLWIDSDMIIITNNTVTLSNLFSIFENNSDVNIIFSQGQNRQLKLINSGFFMVKNDINTNTIFDNNSNSNSWTLKFLNDVYFNPKYSKYYSGVDSHGDQSAFLSYMLDNDTKQEFEKHCLLYDSLYIQLFRGYAQSSLHMKQRAQKFGTMVFHYYGLNPDVFGKYAGLITWIQYFVNKSYVNQVIAKCADCFAENMILLF